MPEFQYTPYAAPLLLAGLVCIFLFVVVWNRRPGPGVNPFLFLLTGVIIWTLSYALELSLVDVAAKWPLVILEYVGITTVPGAWLAFVAEYTGSGKWLNRRNVTLLFIEPVLTVLAFITNDAHHLFWSSQSMVMTDGVAILTAVKGPLFWIHAGYSYIFMATAVVLLVRALIKSPHLYRGQVGMLLIGTAMPWLANAIYLTGLFPFPNLDPTPFAFTFMDLAVGWSLVRYRLMDIVPVARDAVIESMSDGMFVLDSQNRVVDINPVGLKLINATSSTAVIGKLMGELVPGQQALIDQFRNREQANAEIQVGPRFYELRISPLRNRQGLLTGRVLVLHDITGLKEAANQIGKQNEALVLINKDLIEAQKKAEEASRLKSEFLATMSHELRTPLNAIIGFTDLMMTGVTGPLSPVQNDYMNRVLSNGERLLDLINDILDIAKIEAARLDLVSEPFSPTDMVQSIEVRLKSLADKKGLEFKTEVDPALPEVLVGDRHRLEQILTNLLGNAIRFTDKGQVCARLEKVDSAQWAIKVTDTGIGIPPDAQEYIFDEFRQVDGSSQRKYSGTGLGLAIVRKLSTLMGGNVGVQSEVGKGSTFSVKLPLVAAPEAVAVQTS